MSKRQSRRTGFSPEQLQRRAELVPAVQYPDLPVAARRDEIQALLAEHQVVVIAGETGSGKTTQLPKMCLELGRGVKGMIGHTQPRRIAARAVATRIAEELGTELGDAVGYQVRFLEQSSPNTLIKVMTDGILLAEIAQDRLLRRYDTLIIDEAHERSLNIDFLLGYLKTLLPQRPDLKLIITSATIDPERFAAHFSDAEGRPAPILEVSGRTYPVEIRYRPLSDPEDETAEEIDQVTGIVQAVRELSAHGLGDILVFCSGEREIRDAADALRADVPASTLIVPLYSRLSSAEQQRVFAGHDGRKIVIATNVAETSLTVPGIHYVIDTGTARISRYSNRTKVQRLPIEPISQASANQRAGRCGRVAAGVCIRLYSEADFLQRPEFTDPEIQRTHLASVILSMAALDLGDVREFGFVDPPDVRQIRDGLGVLLELGALRSDGGSASGAQLTGLGRRMARLPIDPRLARMILEADRLGCAREVIIIAAGLSIQDPRERPSDAQTAADESHRRFQRDEDRSDFAALLRLWEYVREQQQELSGSAFRRMCKREYLNYLRLREWADLVSQLRRLAKDVSVSWNTGDGVGNDVLHRALLSGLLSQVGSKDAKSGEYLGSRGSRFAIFPGSGLFKQGADLVMAAELVETSRLWGRTVAAIEVAWAEEAGAHVIKRQYSEPRWSAKRVSVVAQEKVTLYGVTLVADRTVAFGKIDPALSRELFIRHALVQDEWRSHHAFVRRNKAFRAELAEQARRSRNATELDEDLLFEFFDARIPAHVVSGRHFDSWWKKAKAKNERLLDLTAEALATDSAIDREQYPDHFSSGPLTFGLKYAFEPGAGRDGITVQVPLETLAQVSSDPRQLHRFGWLVPGLREELATALIRSLPKKLRVQLVPAPDRARAALEPLLAAGPDAPVPDLPFHRWLGDRLYDLTGVDIADEDWNLTDLPAHLKMTFEVTDSSGAKPQRPAPIAVGEDLQQLSASLQERLTAKVQREVLTAFDDTMGAELLRRDLSTWPKDLLELPREISAGSETAPVKGYPCLDLQDPSEKLAGKVQIRVVATAAEQQFFHRRGLLRLLRHNINVPVAAAVAGLDLQAKLTLATAPYPDGTAMVTDCTDAVIADLVDEICGADLIFSHARFHEVLQQIRSHIPPRVAAAVRELIQGLSAYAQVQTHLESAPAGAAECAADIRKQLERFTVPLVISAFGAARMKDYTRYLRALARRTQVLPQKWQRDLQALADIRELEEQFRALESAARHRPVPDPGLGQLDIMLQELRVSLFANGIPTAFPVSLKRAWAAMDAYATPA